MFSLESAIAPDAFVRVVDAFVDVIDLKSFGFAHVKCEEENKIIITLDREFKIQELIRFK